MIHFEWLWAFALLPLPLLVRGLMATAKAAEDSAIRVPFIDDFQSIETYHSRKTKSRWMISLASLAWLALIIATARPQWIGTPIELPSHGRDLMLAVDLSGSMDTADFKLNGHIVNRLQATQSIAGDFIRRRIGDRIGLILFGEQAYLQTPLTFDRDTVRTLLGEAAIGLAGQATAIGDAIGLMVKHLDKDHATQQILILLTDGANTAGEVSPIKAAELAAEKGLKIYTIGIGADEMIVSSLFGRQRVNPSADLDEKALTAIAEKTGGQYFRARDSAALSKIYALINQLEPIEQDARLFRPMHALYVYPLSVAMVLSILILLSNGIGFRLGQHG